MNAKMQRRWTVERPRTNLKDMVRKYREGNGLSLEEAVTEALNLDDVGHSYRPRTSTTLRRFKSSPEPVGHISVSLLLRMSSVTVRFLCRNSM